MTRYAVLFSLALVWLAGSALADRPERASEVVPAEDCEELEIQIDFTAGTIDLAPADMDELAKLEIYYTPRYVRYDIDRSRRGDRCRLQLESDYHRNRWDDDAENEWTVQLSQKYRTSLEMDIGACEARMDLGGIPLVYLVLDVGAADMEIEFSERNPTELEELSVDCGASSLEIYGLANARARAMEFDVGAGSCEIDLRGEIEGELEIDINVGVGSMDVILSRDVALMVEGDDNWLSSLDFRGFDLYETRDGVWKTDDFEDADNRVVITADVAMGSVTIYGKR